MLFRSEVRSFKEFEDRVEKDGEYWDDDIHIYPNYDWEDYGREMFNNCGYELPGDLENYFDFEEYVNFEKKLFFL